VIDDGRNTFNDDAAASVKTGSGHELASCELHASAKRALGGDRIVKFEKALPVATHRENVLVARILALGAFEKWTRIVAEVGGGEATNAEGRGGGRRPAKEEMEARRCEGALSRKRRGVGPRMRRT